MIGALVVGSVMFVVLVGGLLLKFGLRPVGTGALILVGCAVVVLVVLRIGPNVLGRFSSWSQDRALARAADEEYERRMARLKAIASEGKSTLPSDPAVQTAALACMILGLLALFLFWPLGGWAIRQAREVRRLAEAAGVEVPSAAKFGEAAGCISITFMLLALSFVLAAAGGLFDPRSVIGYR